MEKNFIKLENKVERLNSDLELLSYILSHDFKKPLRVLLNNSKEISELSKDDEKLGELSMKLTASSEEIQQMIENLLEYVRLETFHTIYHEIDLNEIIQEIEDKYKEEIKNNNIILNCKNLPVVNGYRKQLIQTFLYLIDNALKYKFPDKQNIIKIEYKIIDNFIEFVIKDNGIGIEEEYFEMIFLLFQRLHTIDEYPGLGSGLALCKKIIEAHGGEIRVESNLNIGSDFYFTIPIIRL